MKRRSLLLALTAGLLSTAASAQGILSTSRITQISPAQAAAGQIITVTVTTPELDPVLATLIKNRVDLFKGLPGRAISGLSSANQPVKILFSAPTRLAASGFLEGQNVTDLGNSTYSVRVPQGAITGRLKYQRGLASSLSTGTFTLVNTGFTVQNSAQYNVVSLKIGGAERLAAGQVLAPGASLNLGTNAGNHAVQFTFGLSAARPLYSAPLGTFAARQSTTGSFPQPLVIGRLLARQFLAAAPLFTIQGNFITTSWQGLDASLNVYGFDFTMNMVTFDMTFKHWAFSKSNVLNSGTVREPSNWPNNSATVLVPLHNSNGTLYGNALLTLNNNGFLPSLVVGDGIIYEMQ